jgi:hypothetical protein
MIALEAALVPERDYVGRLLRERVVRLVHESEDAKKVLAKFYDVRSDIAHGAPIAVERIGLLKDRMEDFESWVRRSLVAATSALSLDEETRTEQLKQLYDISDADRLERLRTAAYQVRPASLRKALVMAISRICKKDS